MNSFNITLERYRALLLAQQEGRLQLPNDNLDTGGVTVPASYKLADDTYAKLLEKTSGKAHLRRTAPGTALLLCRSRKAVCNETQSKGMA